MLSVVFVAERYFLGDLLNTLPKQPVIFLKRHSFSWQKPPSTWPPPYLQDDPSLLERQGNHLAFLSCQLHVFLIPFLYFTLLFTLLNFFWLLGHAVFGTLHMLFFSACFFITLIFTHFPGLNLDTAASKKVFSAFSPLCKLCAPPIFFQSIFTLI